MKEEILAAVLNSSKKATINDDVKIIKSHGKVAVIYGGYAFSKDSISLNMVMNLDCGDIAHLLYNFIEAIENPENVINY